MRGWHTLVAMSFGWARLVIFVGALWWVQLTTITAITAITAKVAGAQTGTGDDPAVASDNSGIARPDDTDYGLLILLGCLLILAGVLLVSVERWARRHTSDRA